MNDWCPGPTTALFHSSRGCARRSAPWATATSQPAARRPERRSLTGRTTRAVTSPAATTGSSTEISGHEIENEDLVNIPNWLPLVFRIGDGPWLRPSEATVEYLDYRQELSLKEGILRRSSATVKDSARTASTHVA